MTSKNTRSVKIYGMSGYKYQATPTIMLKGKWLEELGFEIGDMTMVPGRRRDDMDKVANTSDLMKRPFSELTMTEKAIVLKSRFEKEASVPGTQRIKTREGIGEEYGLSGSSVGRLLKLNDLLDPLKDMVDRGALYTEVAVQLAFLPESEQQMVYKVAKETGTKLTPDMMIKLRSHTGMLTEGFVRRYLRKDPIKKKCYKVPGRIVEKYFQGMDPNMVDSIVEQALDAWFGKEAADVQ